MGDPMAAITEDRPLTRSAPHPDIPPVVATKPTAPSRQAPRRTENPTATYSQALRQIRNESDCGLLVAVLTIFTLAYTARKARMRTRLGMSGVANYNLILMKITHNVMLDIMPDNQVAKKGTAHELLNRLLLEQRGVNLAFMHGKQSRARARDIPRILIGWLLKLDDGCYISCVRLQG